MKLNRMVCAWVNALYAITMTAADSPTARLVSVRDDGVQAVVQFSLPEHDVMLYDTLSMSTDSPVVNVKSWHTNPSPHEIRERAASQATLVLDGSVECVVDLERTDDAPARDVALLVQYVMKNSQRPFQHRFVIAHAAEPAPVVVSHDAASDDARPEPSMKTGASQGQCTASHVDSLFDLVYERIHRAIQHASHMLRGLKTSFSYMLQHSDSFALQLVLGLLLGILMSLTPCIYPMIPVTAGLLGANHGNSVFRNFLLASSYTVGLATLFAVLGLSAAYFGAQCGQLMCNPWVIGILIAVLAYAGGSMFGWYEMWTPAALVATSSIKRDGSLVSAFLFGVATGTIASPCMSPGLALILSIVPTLGSVARGFLLLFAFGVGSSLPLVIVGTFSGSLQLLPRSGMWMMEIKKVFGYLLFMVCFYYLQMIFPPYVSFAGASLFTIACALAYAWKMITARSRGARLWACCASVLLVGVGLYAGYLAFLTKYVEMHPTEFEQKWEHSYEQAQARAQSEKKLLLLDFTARWCSLCTVLNTQFLHAPELNPLFSELVAVKIDGSDRNNPEYKALVERYKVPGLPYLILVVAGSGEEVAHWGSELLDGTPAEFLAQVRTLIAAHPSAQHHLIR